MIIERPETASTMNAAPSSASLNAQTSPSSAGASMRLRSGIGPTRRSADVSFTPPSRIPTRVGYGSALLRACLAGAALTGAGLAAAALAREFDLHGLEARSVDPQHVRDLLQLLRIARRLFDEPSAA